MKQALPPLTQDLIEAFVASAWSWLLRLLAVLVSPRATHRRRRLTRLVQRAERRGEYVLFNMAAERLLSRFGPPRRRGSLVIARPGFRLAKGDNRLLLKSARIRLRGADLLARTLHLLAALISPERYVARYTKRLARGLHFFRLVAAAPAAVPYSSARAPAPTIANSS